MKVSDSHIIERQGVSLVEILAVRDLRWLFREQNVSDVGIDAHLEVVVGGSATGRLLAIQIKSGESYFREPVPDGFVYRGDSEHLEYWLNHALPVLVVICNPVFQEAYWQVIAEETIERTASGWKIVIPKANQFRAEAMEKLERIAARQAERRTQGGTTIYRREAVVHPDSILGAVLAEAASREDGSSLIKTGSVTYTCSRIASMENLAAVLVSANSSDGTVFILSRAEDRWTVVTKLGLSTKYYDVLPAFFVPVGETYCLVVQHPTCWGTGTILYQEKWWLLADEPQLVLEYPVKAYVVGWGTLFDRWINGECTSVPSELQHGARLEVTIRLKYAPSSQIFRYNGVRGFEVTRVMRLAWDNSRRCFFTLSDSDMSAEDTLDAYLEADAGIIVRNLRSLEALVPQADAGLLTWLRDIAEKAEPNERSALCRANAYHRNPKAHSAPKDRRRIGFRRLLDLQISAVRPLCGMFYHTGAHHVEVNVYDATMQMCAGLDGGGVIAVLPERP